MKRLEWIFASRAKKITVRLSHDDRCTLCRFDTDTSAIDLGPHAASSLMAQELITLASSIILPGQMPKLVLSALGRSVWKEVRAIGRETPPRAFPEAGSLHANFPEQAT